MSGQRTSGVSVHFSLLSLSLSPKCISTLSCFQ
jgi:hypothetical protein